MITNDISDIILEKTIKDFETNLQIWAEARGLWHDAQFKTHFQQSNTEPSEIDACVTVLTSEGGMFNMINGYSYPDYLDEFELFMDGQDFWYEMESAAVFHFYAKDELLNQRYLQYFEWKWICELIKPDYTDMYHEIFDYFHKQPDKLYHISSRKFEILISEVFKNQGYSTELGKGQGDGGVDVRLFKKDEIDQIVTLVQVKKYRQDRPIDLQAVSSLSAIVSQENANRGLFVTTSRYLPVAQGFAARERSRLTLANADDVSRWCEMASNKILRDKSTLFTDEYLLSLFTRTSKENILKKIFQASVGYGMISHDFCILVKETKNIGLLMRLPKHFNYSDYPYNTIGTETPVLSVAALQYKDKNNVFRAEKKIEPDGRISYWGDGELYFAWEGNPIPFDHND